MVRNDGRSVAAGTLDGMLAALAHRGPEHAGHWIDGAVGLAQCTRSTPPPDAPSAAPWRDVGRDMAVTADARIDNRDELIAALGPGAWSDPAHGDGPLILAAYQRWGDACAERLLGDFAFAIWDGPRRRLFGARDAFGLRPFCYHHGASQFAFASEVKGLLAVPEMPRRLDETRVMQYLAVSFDDQARTIYDDVRRLPPAHSLSVDARGLRLQRYWAPDPSQALVLGSDGEYAEVLRERFRDAVGRRMRDAAPLGAMLSGGLDSSSIACTARDVLRASGGASLHTFSVVFDAVSASDERQYMQAVLDDGGMTPHVVHGDRIGPLHDIARVIGEQAEPFLGPNLFLHAAMYRAARDAGVRVLLDGLDGDTTISHGLGRLTELAGAGRWLTLGREVGALSTRFGGASRATILKGAVAPLLPASVRRRRARMQRRPTALDALGATLDPDFRARTGFDAWARDVTAASQQLPRTERQHHAAQLSRGLVTHCIEVADRSASAHGIDARYPFFDRRLVELCLSVPAEQKLRNGWTRWIMREAMHGVLPPTVQWRAGKSNLGHNFMHTLRAFDGDCMHDALVAGADRLAPYLRPGIAVATRARLDGEPTWEAAGPALRMTVLSLWLRDARLD